MFHSSDECLKSDNESTGRAQCGAAQGRQQGRLLGKLRTWRCD